MKLPALLLISAVGFALVGCGGGDIVKEEDNLPPPATDDGATTNPGSDPNAGDGTQMDPGNQGTDPNCTPPCEFSRDAISDPSSVLAQKIIYFDYDESTIRQEFEAVIAAHARFLATYGDIKVRLEGHADERGSREYNIALGERRAIGVRRQLLLQGMRQDQVNTISYGEELPAALGHNDEAWAKNRRVEIVYETR